MYTIPTKTLQCSCRYLETCFSTVKNAAATPSVQQETTELLRSGNLIAQWSRFLFCLLGNGPSGICLSYLLSGYTPYRSPDAAHPNPLLQRKLGEQPHLSLLEQVNTHELGG